MMYASLLAAIPELAFEEPVFQPAEKCSANRFEVHCPKRPAPREPQRFPAAPHQYRAAVSLALSPRIVSAAFEWTAAWRPAARSNRVHREQRPRECR